MEQVHRSCFSFSVGKSSSVVSSDDARSSRTNVEEQLADGDALLKCFRPLLRSMRVFGLHGLDLKMKQPVIDPVTSTVVSAVVFTMNLD